MKKLKVKKVLSFFIAIIIFITTLPFNSTYTYAASTAAQKILNDTSLGLTADKKRTLAIMMDALLDAGFEPAFVAGALGNIAKEGSFGLFEGTTSSGHMDYMKYMNKYYQYYQKYSYKYIYNCNLTEVCNIDNELYAMNYINNETGRCGFALGSCQWTFSRTHGLLLKYRELAGNSSTISYEQVMRAECLYMVEELSGKSPYSNKKYVYNNWITANSGNLSSDAAADSAARIFCTQYELPSEYSTEKIQGPRADYAVKIYNICFSDKINRSLMITGETKPSGKLEPGKPFYIKGKITSYPSKINHVWGGVYYRDGRETDQQADVNPNSNTYDLASYFDYEIIFNKLSVGYYTYRIEVTTEDGQKKSIESDFQIGDPVKPSNVKLSIPKTEYMKDEKIVFTPSGTNVTQYSIGIDDASGNRKKSVAVAVGSTYSISDLAAGNYSAYVTGTNNAGYTDSARITFSIGITATLNANGGSCSTGSKRVVTGSKYGELPTPVRSGYTFSGWYTATTGGSQVTKDTVVTLGSNHTLYARWSQINYTVKFDANGGTGSMGNQSIARDQSVNLTANAFAKTGYIFANWNTKADGSGTSYADKASVKNLATGGGTITLYAVWKPKTISVTFYRNRNEEDENTVIENFTYGTSNQRFGYNTSGTGRYKTMNAENVGFGEWTNPGYELLGWSKTRNSSTAEYSTYSTVSNDWINQYTPSVKLYAVWKPMQYTLKVDPNGGKYDNSTTAVTKSPNLIYGRGNWWTIGEEGNATRTGYTLTGYYTAATGGTKVYDANGEYVESAYWKDKKYINAGNLTVYAQWKANTYSVKLVYNDGTDKTETIKVIYDSTYTELPESPEREGYNFTGWYTGKDEGSTVSYVSKVSTASDQTLYAHWSKEKIMIMFETNGGTSDTATKQVSYDNKYGVLPEAERSGYTFDGWYLDKELTKPVTEGDTVKVSSNHTLYAKWNIVQYTVTFDTKGGTAETESKKVVYGKKYGVLPEAEKENDVFLGWYTEDGKEITSESTVEIEKDTVLYAKWESETVIRGDVNNDGVVNAVDIAWLNGYMFGNEEHSSEEAMKSADLNDDGIVNILDYIYMKSILFESDGE